MTISDIYIFLFVVNLTTTMEPKKFGLFCLCFGFGPKLFEYIFFQTHNVNMLIVQEPINVKKILLFLLDCLLKQISCK